MEIVANKSQHSSRSLSLSRAYHHFFSLSCLLQMRCFLPCKYIRITSYL